MLLAGLALPCRQVRIGQAGESLVFSDQAKARTCRVPLLVAVILETVARIAMGTAAEKFNEFAVIDGRPREDQRCPEMARLLE